MMERLEHLIWSLKDDARHHPFVRLAAMRWMECLARWMPGGGVPEALKACAYAASETDMRRCAEPVRRLLGGAQGREMLARQRWGMSAFTEFVAKNPGLSRTIVLKAPRQNGERGVMVTHFEYNWLRFAQGIKDWRNFSQGYDVIYTTSWSPPNYAAVAMLLAVTEGLVMVQPNHRDDVRLLEAFHPRVRATRCIVSEWLLPEAFAPRSWAERDIDLLYVAGWGAFKRHREFFEVLRRLPRGLRVVCVGQPDGQQRLEQVLALKERMGVPQAVEFHERMVIDEVTQLQCRSKVAVLFSRREGANIAAAEALMAGALLAMRADAHVGARAYVNDATGALFEARTAAAVLMKLLAGGGEKAPHVWAQKHLSCRETIPDLNATVGYALGLPLDNVIYSPSKRPFTVADKGKPLDHLFA